MTRKSPLTNDCGDTIVEVVVSFVILMLVIAAFGGTVGLAVRMEQRADRTRQNAAQVAQTLREVETAAGASGTVSFSGENGGFSVPVNYGSKTVKDADGNAVTLQEFAGTRRDTP